MDPEHCEVALKREKLFFGWYNTVIGHPSNKRTEFKFKKKIIPCHYSSMSEIVAELNAKMLAGSKNIHLHLNGFDICFDYDYFSNKSVVTMSHRISIKMEGWDLAMQLGFKGNEILSELTPIVYCES